MSLEKLIALAYKKNTINLRRRRFLALKYQCIGVMSHNFFSKKFILAGIEKAGHDMKKLTKQMSKLCKKNNARLVWNDSWMIKRIIINPHCWTIGFGYVQNANYREIERKDFKKIVLDYEAERFLLDIK
jgi:hypothetical protein